MQLQRCHLTPAGVDAATAATSWRCYLLTLSAFSGSAILDDFGSGRSGMWRGLRWEPSRDGVLYPHLYGLLNEDMVGARFKPNAARDGLSANGAAA